MLRARRSDDLHGQLAHDDVPGHAGDARPVGACVYGAVYQRSVYA